MTNRERVMAALRGERVDRVPVSFWAHNFATENSAEDLAAETARLAREFGWDYLKPQSRAQCFAEMWGLTYTPSGERAVPSTTTRTPLATAVDVAGLKAADPRTGSLGEQLQALRLIRAAVGPDTPIIWTVFAPIMVMPFLVQGGRDRVLEMARTEPAALARGLEAITETLAGYATLCLDAGADGLFYATNVATEGLLTAPECRRFQRPFDLLVLSVVERAPFNVMHVCGSGIRFGEFADYPVHAISWALAPGNPTLAEGRDRSGKAAMGGVPAKPAIASMTPEAVAERARAAVRDTEGRALLLAPDCSINPDTPDALLHAARDAAHRMETSA